MSDTTCLESCIPAPPNTAVSSRRSAWGADPLPAVSDPWHCAGWIQREAGRHWRAGGSVLLLWIEPTEPCCNPQPQDRLMVELGRRVRQRLRATDRVVQVGTSAVCAILFDAGAAMGNGVRQRMRAGLRGVYALGSHSVMLDVSVGVAAQTGVNGSAEDLLANARQFRDGA